MTLAPNVQDVINHVSGKDRWIQDSNVQAVNKTVNGKERSNAYICHHQWISQEHGSHAQQQHKDVIRRPATATRIEGSTRFVLLAKCYQHVTGNEEIKTEWAGKAKGRQKPPNLQTLLHVWPGPNDFMCADHAEIDTKGDDHGGTEPVPCNDRQLLDPLLRRIKHHRKEGDGIMDGCVDGETSAQFLSNTRHTGGSHTG